MKKKIYFDKKPTKTNTEDQKEKIDKINQSLIELRKSFLSITNSNDKLKIKLLHFNKLFKNKIKKEDKVNYISYHLFQDRINK
jgi:hypothetical protein